MSLLRRNVNLDELVQDIHNWQKQIDELWETNQRYELDIKSMRRQCETCETKEKNAIKDASEMHTLVDKLQDILTTRCHIEVQNRTLKDQIEDLKNTIARQNKENKENEDKWKKERQDMIDKHTEEVASVIQDGQIEMQKEVCILERKLDEKTQSVKSLQKQMADAEKAKHTEIVKLKLEYDAKMSKLQKQATKSQQVGNRNASSNSDIFRQKLKFAKEASEKEICTLKRTISDLERKLINQQASKRKKF
ncbi:uncharacterized protein [Antedon mediterranea]|uniref:uncharacterized protein n=1 Tax=Antedon mediterranea TaxID=105859 RepID=UPI003AF9BB73